jgi:hypothetical protein
MGGGGEEAVARSKTWLERKGDSLQIDQLFLMVRALPFFSKIMEGNDFQPLPDIAILILTVCIS